MKFGNNTNPEPNEPVVVDPAPVPTEPKVDQGIPKHRFDEVNNLMKEYKTKLDELEAQAEAQKKADLEKTQQFEELYRSTQKELEEIRNSKTSADSKVSEYEKVVQSLVDTKMEVVPDELKALIPETFTPTQKLEWLNKAESNGLFKRTAPIGQPTNVSTDIQSDPSEMSATLKMSQAYLKNGTSKIKSTIV